MKNVIYYASLIVLFVSLLGSDACQRDYSFADNAKLASPSPSASASPSPSPSPSESPDDTASATASSSATASASPSASPSASTIALAVSEKSFLTELENAPASQPVSNWLGKNYSDKESVSGTPLDSDNDGYSDLLENDFGTNANDANSYPDIYVSNISNRFINEDTDYDGLPDTEENQRGTNANNSDSDKDGFTDGAELLSKSDLLDKNSKPKDLDGDGLSTDFENLQGTNPKNSDTDGDSLRDDTEYALGTDPNKTDSDYDGILDGKEVEIGSDPIIPELNVK